MADVESLAEIAPILIGLTLGTGGIATLWSGHVQRRDERLLRWSEERQAAYANALKIRHEVEDVASMNYVNVAVFGPDALEGSQNERLMELLGEFRASLAMIELLGSWRTIVVANEFLARILRYAAMLGIEDWLPDETAELTDDDEARRMRDLLQKISKTDSDKTGDDRVRQVLEQYEAVKRCGQRLVSAFRDDLCAEPPETIQPAVTRNPYREKA